MKKIFLSALIVLIFFVQNFCCAAATIYEGYYNGYADMPYPVVKTGNAAVDQKINAAILTELNRFVADVYATAQTNGYEVESISTKYEVTCNEAGNTAILSFRIVERRYYKRAPRAWTYFRAMNFTTNTGEIIDIDFFKKFALEKGIDEQMLKYAIGQKLREHCQRKGIHLLESANPLKKLPENFYWDSNLHLHFIFQQYEVAPGTAGIIDVDIDA